MLFPLNLTPDLRGRLPSSRGDLLSMARADLEQGLVKIDDAAIRSVDWPLSDLRPMVIGLDGAVATTREGAMAFVLLMTAINFKFWRLNDGKFERYTFNGKTGARALWAAFEAAWGLGEVSADLFAQHLAESGVGGIFGDIPDASSRSVMLHEIISGDIAGISAKTVARITTCGRITVADAEQIARAWPLAYGDPYLKKIQLALSKFGGYLRSVGVETDSSDLTAFADYQVPRVLRSLGILQYAAPLAALVDDGTVIAPDSAEERCIRAATILACERIAAHCNATAADVDNLLWGSQEVASKSRFHLTPTTWY